METEQLVKEIHGHFGSPEIEELEKKKSELIEEIKHINRRIRYKKYEKEALKPYLEQTKDVQIAPFRKQKRAIEFRIATSAYTPKMEKDLLKELKKIDTQLDKVKEVDKARRKAKYVEQDITEGEAQITKIEVDLKAIREKLKVLYDEVRANRAASKRQADDDARADSDLVAMGDLALIEKEN
ncbi:hypothetical protein HY988_05500 [Candidatus Micrarchaeota archaeon]|nr:hypothetical protein [Candidatus Micrarchaeota archaeon]